MRKPIYDSSPQDKLKDLLEAVLMAQKILAMDLSRYSTKEEQYREGLTEGEFAIGNWIVRPRFPDQAALVDERASMASISAAMSGISPLDSPPVTREPSPRPAPPFGALSS